jgi:DNA-binding HxlR family transcriptional regulator
MRNDQDSQLSAKFLQVICQLHEWESQHLDEASTQAGRYLYLNLARQLQDTQGGPSAFLKGIYYNKDLSERALRYKIREFENDGLIEFEAHVSDKRSKRILPTPTLLNTLDAHAQEFSRMLSNEFLIFPKK